MPAAGAERGDRAFVVAVGITQGVLRQVRVVEFRFGKIRHATSLSSPPPLRGRSASTASREGGEQRPPAQVSTPLPDPPPQGGREKKEARVFATRDANK